MFNFYFHLIMIQVMKQINFFQDPITPARMGSPQAAVIQQLQVTIKLTDDPAFLWTDPVINQNDDGIFIVNSYYSQEVKKLVEGSIRCLRREML